MSPRSSASFLESGSISSLDLSTEANQDAHQPDKRGKEKIRPEETLQQYRHGELISGFHALHIVSTTDSQLDTATDGVQDSQPHSSEAKYNRSRDGNVSVPLSTEIRSHSQTESYREEIEQENPHSFQKWMKTLRRKRDQRRATHIYSCSPRPHQSEASSVISWPSLHRISSSETSFAYVTAVRSASVSLASLGLGIAAKSKRSTTDIHSLTRTRRSSQVSISFPVPSEEELATERNTALDKQTVFRSLQRYRVLQELVATEEGYLDDIRFLMNAYVTFLASLPSLRQGLRQSINRNLAKIFELHEEILHELHRKLSRCEYIRPHTPRFAIFSPDERSIDARVEANATKSLHQADQLSLTTAPVVLCDPQTVSEVTQIFDKKINSFFVYKEYSAKYEMMMHDISSASEVMPEWEIFQKGFEVLAATLAPIAEHEDTPRKSMTMNDLVVKPIQRVCRYPLLFAELLKYTPVTDCPNSHMELEKTLDRLRQTTEEIDRATSDGAMRATLEKTWLLQDRLVFPSKIPEAESKERIRSFGYIEMCGTLHICWQSSNAAQGKYFICLLYPEVFCLAVSGKIDGLYHIVACMDAREVRVEDADNGRGLQCHSAPFSWKLIFVCDYQLYEIIMTACTPKEEFEWLARLGRNTKETNPSNNSTSVSCGFLDLDIKSLGVVFGRPGSVARKKSIHRAITVGSKPPLCQVVLKNTSLLRDTSLSAAATTASINRSQSLLTTNTRVPVFSPARSERARLEALLSDVWTRDVLPFPGLTAKSRGEHLIRRSASSVMSKLSVASIASSFTKRSGSLSQKTKSTDGLSLAGSSGSFQPRDTQINISEAKVETVALRLGPTRAKRPRTTQSTSTNLSQDDGFHKPIAASGSQEETGKDDGGLIQLPTAGSPSAKRQSRSCQQRKDGEWPQSMTSTQTLRKASKPRRWTRPAKPTNRKGDGLLSLFR